MFLKQTVYPEEHLKMVENYNLYQKIQIKSTI